MLKTKSQQKQRQPAHRLLQALNGLVYRLSKKGIKVVINLGFAYSLVMVVLLYLGLLLACKVTSLGASAAGLAVVTVITAAVSLIPSIGGFVALVAQYFMLKRIDPHGSVIFTMIINIVTTFFVLFLFMKVMNNVSIRF